MKKNYPDMHVLDETDTYFIGHIFEEAYLIEKRNGEEIVRDSFYGDPTCGLISIQNDWAIIAGEHITIWKAGKKTWLNGIGKGKITIVADENLKWIHSIRTADNRTVEILIQPWEDHSAIWTLDMESLQFKKKRDFDDYKEKEYTDEIVW